MSDDTKSYIVRRGNGISPAQVNCYEVIFTDGGSVVFNNEDGLVVCAFSSWESIEVMNQSTGQGDGWINLRVI